MMGFIGQLRVFLFLSLLFVVVVVIVSIVVICQLISHIIISLLDLSVCLLPETEKKAHQPPPYV